MIIYQIEIPTNQDPEAFVMFMQDEYFPAVHKGATRVGQVTALTLVQRANEKEGDNFGREFIWKVDWNGLPTDTVRVDDEEVTRKFDAFQAKLTRLGFYRTVASWAGGSGS